MTDKNDKMDIAFLGPETPTGRRVVRMRGTQENPEVSLGELRPIKEGEPIYGDVVSLHRRGNSDVCTVETVIEHPLKAKPREAHGPAMVATEAYRDGWDRVFGGKSRDTLVN
jgi:hypothetical protein